MKVYCVGFCALAVFALGCASGTPDIGRDDDGKVISLGDCHDWKDVSERVRGAGDGARLRSSAGGGEGLALASAATVGAPSLDGPGGDAAAKALEPVSIVLLAPGIVELNGVEQEWEELRGAVAEVCTAAEAAKLDLVLLIRPAEGVELKVLDRLLALLEREAYLRGSGSVAISMPAGPRE